MARKAKTRFLVLGLLRQGPRSGYDIAVAVNEARAFFWHESFSSIYPMLKQLEDEGLIRTKSAERTGRRKRVYEITADGRAAVERWLAEPPAPDVIRNELLLKISFGDGTTPAVLAGHVQAYLRRLEEAAAELEEGTRRIEAVDASERQKIYWRLTADLGRRVTEARRAWAEDALCKLEQLEA